MRLEAALETVNPPELVQHCTKKVQLIVRVIDEDDRNNDAAPLSGTRLTAGLGDDSYSARTSNTGTLSLIFNTYEPSEAKDLTLEDDHGLPCRIGEWMKIAETASYEVYRVHAFYSRHWTLRVRVYDGQPAGFELEPVALAGVPLHFAWPNQQAVFTTGEDGAAFDCPQMEFRTAYTMKPLLLGAVPEETTFKLRGHDGCTVTLDEDEITLTVPPPSRAVEVDVTLRFEKVLIVGEGTDFRYAVPLAQKYANTYRYRRNHGTDAEGILGRQVARRWIFASQYDVDPAPNAPPDNLYVYPNPITHQGAQRRFDVTNQGHWSTLAQLHGADFRDVIFNNPHPGYGLHMCEVMGVDPDLAYRAHYISVHSIGHEDPLVDKDVIHGLLGDRWEDPAHQRTVLQQDLQIVRDGTDTLGDYTGGGRQSKTIGQLFESSQSSVTFTQRNRHYTFRWYIAPLINEIEYVSTTGLKEFILVKYAELGPSVLRRGGKLRINGSAQIRSDLEEAGLYAEEEDGDGFENLGSWSEEEYFVQYQTNFTHDRQHPSWFAKRGFNPGEPNIQQARVYALTKE